MIRKLKKTITLKNTFNFLKKVIIGSILTSVVVSIIAIGYATYRVVTNLNSIQAINRLELIQNNNSEIYANDGTTLIYTDSKYQHKNLSLTDTPDILLKLLFSTEDKTYRTNDGYSPEGTANMFLTSGKYYSVKLLRKIPGVSKIFSEPSEPRGGSTLTQQLVKNIRYLDTDLDVVDRKIQEMALAIRLTDDYSKDEILEAYLNKVGFLESSYGFNTAYYLLYGDTISKDDTSDTSIARFATIVGMLKNPSIYNPRTNPVDAKNRRDTVLYNAYQDGHLTKKQFETISKIPIEDGLKDQGWFTQQVYEVASEHGSYVNSILEQLDKYGYDLDNKEYPIKVISNLNIAENKWLQDEVRNPAHYANERQQIAVTVVEPGTGKVLAQVGSRNGASATDLNRATQETRSSGSTIKPFLSYAPLIEFMGYDTNATFGANTTTYPGTNVTVYNYGRYMYGTVTMQYALKQSLNVPAVTALSYQEPWMNQTIMDNLGLKNHKYDENWNLLPTNQYGGSDALGINESTRNFAGAFAAVANSGKYVEPMYISEVTQNGQTIKIEPRTTQAMSPRTASKLISMLETTLHPDGSARSAAIPEFAGYAAKTGTVGMAESQPLYYDLEHTQYAGTAAENGGDMLSTDSWISGMTKSVAVSVWTGFDDQSIYGDWITPGMETRTEVFVNVMRHFNAGKDTSEWTISNETVELSKTNLSNTVTLSSVDKYNTITMNPIKVQDVIKNSTQANPQQKEFYNKYLQDVLDAPYQNIKNYYENNDIKGYAFKTENSQGSKFYSIDDSGNIIKE